jgi:hypothetical protein
MELPPLGWDELIRDSIPHRLHADHMNGTLVKDQRIRRKRRVAVTSRWSLNADPKAAHAPGLPPRTNVCARRLRANRVVNAVEFSVRNAGQNLAFNDGRPTSVGTSARSPGRVGSDCSSSRAPDQERSGYMNGGVGTHNLHLIV